MKVIVKIQVITANLFQTLDRKMLIVMGKVTPVISRQMDHQVVAEEVEEILLHAPMDLTMTAMGLRIFQMILDAVVHSIQMNQVEEETPVVAERVLHQLEEV
jgi:hypothetical protein